jgi:tRNA wybutosine-synthesizing protein 1
MEVEKIALDDAVRKRYANATYGIAGNHSGVQICSWTKKALRGKGVCYKQKFYGVDCIRCCQMSPALAWCSENCVFCWRPMEWMRRIEMRKGEVDDPETVIEKCVEQRDELIAGIGGAHDVNKDSFARTFRKFPAHWAISLSGEPTIYPKIGELIKQLRSNSQVKSIFIVTNGQEPECINLMAKQGDLPTQLYVSVTASNEEDFKKINKPVYPDGWYRLNKTLGMLKDLDCRSVIRFTLIKGLNDSEEQLERFAEIFENSHPDFVEIKSYMHLGLSQKRLKMENMPYHEDVKKCADKILEYAPSYAYENEDERSRIVLIKRKDSKVENVIRKA